MRKIETPKYASRDDVYEPAEDSFLVLDALEIEEFDEDVSICVEIGCGSGILSAGLVEALSPSSTCFFIAVDVNKSACDATKETFALNDVSSGRFDIINADGFEALKSRLKSTVDVVICNPPYVATSEDEAGKSGLVNAWAGGGNGRNVTDKVIEALPTILRPQSGKCFLVVEQCNDISDIINFIREDKNLKVEEVMRRRAGRELLAVLKIQTQ